MKIVMVTPYYADHRGGIEIAADNLAKNMVSLSSVQIIWIASNLFSQEASENSQIIFNPIHSWNFTEKWLGIPYPIWSPFEMWHLYQMIRNADVVMFHDAIYASTCICFLLGKILRKPTLLVQHIGSIPYSSLGLRVLMKLANRLIAVPLISSVDKVIFISKTTEDYFSNQNIQYRTAPSLIFNGVDQDCFKQNLQIRHSIREQMGIESEQLVCLFVGRFVEKKGLNIIRQLASKMTNITWVLAGWGPIEPEKWGLPNLRVERDHHKLTLAPLYNAADLFVLPSRGEGFPLVIQEAISCGLPVVCTDETAKADMALESMVYTAPITDDLDETTSVWMDVIQNALLHQDTYSVSLAMEYAENHWSWNHTASQYLEIIDEIAG